MSAQVFVTTNIRLKLKGLRLAQIQTHIFIVDSFVDCFLDYLISFLCNMSKNYLKNARRLKCVVLFDIMMSLLS